MSIFSEVIKLGSLLLRVTTEYDEDGNVVSGRADNITSPAKEATVPDRIVEREE